MSRTRRLSAWIATGSTAALLCGAAIGEAAARSGSYSGTTSEHVQVTLKVSGHSLRAFKTVIGYNGKCGQGGGPGYTIDVARVALKSNGSFSARIVLHSPNLKLTKNRRADLTGKASESTVRGKIVGVKFTFSGCNGYTETFTAKRG